MKLKKRLLKQKFEEETVQTDEGPVQDVEEGGQLEPESAACGSSPADEEMNQGEDDEDVDCTYASIEESTERDNQDEVSNQEVR